MAPKQVQGYEFVVEGSHDFPIDMLRYDRCWPRSEDQAIAVAPYHFSQFREKRQVKLRGLNEPTDGRWESFGWRVVSFDRVVINVN